MQCQEEIRMRKARLFTAALIVSALTIPMLAQAHPGGCRKSSPPGKCCHMEKKTGKVHCH